MVLTHNLDVSLGLTNGTSGRVVGFAFHEGKAPYTGDDVQHAAACNRPPPVVLVEFKSYKGDASYSSVLPACQHLGTAVIPVMHQHCGCVNGLSRHQLPLRLAHAVTSHGVQGYTAHEGIIYVPHTRPGDLNIVYVALSRPTRLSHICLVGVLRPDHFTSKKHLRAAIDSELYRLETGQGALGQGGRASREGASSEG